MVYTERVLNSLFQVLRGLQLQKGILIEGDRQSGKKCLVEHLGHITNEIIQEVHLCE